MSLRKVKTVYLIAVIVLAVLLATLGDVICWIAAIVLLVGALPMFKVMGRAFSEHLIDEINHRRVRASRPAMSVTAVQSQDDAAPQIVAHLE